MPTLQGNTLRSALSLAAQVMSDLDGDLAFALHIASIGHAAMTDMLADVVLAVITRVVDETGSLETYWEGIEHRGIPLYECANAIATVMQDRGLSDAATLEAAAIDACLALLQPIPTAEDRHHG
jgi:hypothetical protein